MGGDGGVVAVNRRYMRQCAGDGFLGSDVPPDAVSKQQITEMRTKVCAMSMQPLSKPIVACELGLLYNKDVVLEALLECTVNPAFAHIKGMKDVFEAKLEPNRAHGESKDGSTAEFACPVTQQEMNGKQPFVIIRTTGKVLSEKAIREVGLEGLQAEYGPFAESDIIKLAPSPDELQVNKQRLEERKQQRKRAKRDKGKGKKAKKQKLEAPQAEAEGADEAGTKATGTGTVPKEKKKSKRHNVKAAPSAATASMNQASKISDSAKEAVATHTKDSAVYKSIFGSKEASKNDIFIATATHLYNL
ncbi:unnamed protein product [Chrysoparadoxa australica]